MDHKYTIAELLELAHRYKCARLKVGPLEVELSPAAFGSAEPLSVGGEKVPSAEDFMFMAGLQVEAPDADGDSGGN